MKKIKSENTRKIKDEKKKKRKRQKTGKTKTALILSIIFLVRMMEKMESRTKAIDVVTFMLNTPLERKGIFEELSRLEILKAIRAELKSRPNGPVILIFPEAALGMKAISRIESKRFVSRINRVLSAHGNAFVFFSVIEKISRGGKARPRALVNYSISNTGYIITPSKTKKWFAYPKLTQRKNFSLKNISGYDYNVLLRNARLPLGGGGKEEISEIIKKWERRARSIKGFPQLRIGGKDVQLRVCCDLTLAGDSPSHKAVNSKRKADLIIVPARGYIDGLVPSNAAQKFSGALKKRGAVFISDESFRKISYYKKPEGSPLGLLKGFRFAKKGHDPFTNPIRKLPRRR
ncbi:MAG: hypothetical protein NTZ73_02795 [Candidatus Diapherotrites archaeon]|nr:hypothetical protein [Candidatus Diapherotrites archaeon]